MQNNSENLANIAADFQPTADEQQVLRGAMDGHNVIFDGAATIRAEFLKILLLGIRADWPMSSAGIQFEGSGVLLEGALDLRHARAKDGGALPAVQIQSCRTLGGIDFSDAKISRLAFDHCTELLLSANRTEIDGDLTLRGAECRGIQLDGVHIAGSLRAEETRLESDQKEIFSAVGAHINGDLMIDRMQSRNCGFDFSNAQIGSGCLC